ncbi:MAG: NADPH:quinone reductase [Burkholderiaceae bacterium]|nr:NADPH:quinone reductase [Burkholderiaceae bacterium]
MLAVTYQRVGPASEVLSVAEIATPSAAAGEVRVKLASSGVNPSDVKSRAGVRNKTLAFPLIVPHSDGAGVIDQVGDGVDPARIGERVWVWNAAWQRPLGTAAQYVALPAQQAVTLPDAIDFAAGACLGIPALTAYHAVALGGGVSGKSVLVTGGAGAVGHYAIQFAKLGGAARVIATVSSDAKGAIALEAGADAFINYRTEDVGQRCVSLTGGSGVDRIIEMDLAANIQSDLAALRSDGDIVVYGSGAPDIAVPFFASILKNTRYHFFIVYNLNAADRASDLAEVSRLLRENRLKHQIAARMPLSEAAEAHQLVESGQAIGNVVLDIS